MPKASGSTMKPTRMAPRAAAPFRKIMSFPLKSLGGQHTPEPSTKPTASNALAAEAVRIAGSQGGINPKQMHS